VISDRSLVIDRRSPISEEGEAAGAPLFASFAGSFFVVRRRDRGTYPVVRHSRCSVQLSLPAGFRRSACPGLVTRGRRVTRRGPGTKGRTRQMTGKENWRVMIPRGGPVTRSFSMAQEPTGDDRHRADAAEEEMMDRPLSPANPAHADGSLSNGPACCGRPSASLRDNASQENATCGRGSRRSPCRSKTKESLRPHTPFSPETAVCLKRQFVP